MGSTFDVLWGEVKQSFPNLSPFLAKRFVQRAVQDIYDSRQWSFLQAEGVLFTPAAYSQTSGMQFSQYSNQVACDANTITNLSGPSIGMFPPITKRQISFNDRTQIYNIMSLDPNFTLNGIIFLDRPVLEPAVGAFACPFTIFRCYYGPPSAGTLGAETTDFLRYNSIYNPVLANFLVNVQSPRQLLDRKDPQRVDMGIPYYLYTYKGASDGTPQFELWPHPMAENILLCSYQRLGTIPTANSGVLPIIIGDDLVIAKAKCYACLWADANKSHYDDLKGVNWLLQYQQYKREYSNFSSFSPGGLERTQIQDEEAFPQSIIIDNRSYGIDAIGTDEQSGFYSIDPN